MQSLACVCHGQLNLLITRLIPNLICSRIRIFTMHMCCSPVSTTNTSYPNFSWPPPPKKKYIYIIIPYFFSSTTSMNWILCLIWHKRLIVTSTHWHNKLDGCRLSRVFLLLCFVEYIFCDSSVSNLAHPSWVFFFGPIYPAGLWSPLRGS